MDVTVTVTVHVVVKIPHKDSMVPKRNILINLRYPYLTL